MRLRRFIGTSITVVLLVAAVAGSLAYRSFFRTPTTRLALDGFYPEMPRDFFHRYLVLPVDHENPGRGSFNNFYILSRSFKRGSPVVFLLTDGQMELASTHPDYEFFDELFPGISYVLLGVRGQAPNLFPEVFRQDGSLDLRAATELYSSDQQVEDIEAVRRDMERRGDLPMGGKVSVYGASGAGILAQQYIARYGEHVDRAILEVSGAPDLSQREHQTYARDFSAFNPDGAAELQQVLLNRKHISSSNLSYVLYQTARAAKYPKNAQLQMLGNLKHAMPWRYMASLLHPQSSLPFARFLLSSPEAAMVKVRWYEVRWYELVGADLQHYEGWRGSHINLLYEFSQPVLADFFAAARSNEIHPKLFAIDRSHFDGEVLVISGNDDVVFSPDIGRVVAKEYKSSVWMLLPGGHHLLEDRRFLQRLRTAFIMSGLRSNEFQSLRSEPRILQQQ